ncbi:MAG: hypothetical protein OXT07_06240 [bacterium]|nr:hypothetical protein [bacterium]
MDNPDLGAERWAVKLQKLLGRNLKVDNPDLGSTERSGTCMMSPTKLDAASATCSGTTPDMS